MRKEYALYKGEELLHIGTIAEIAEKEEVKRDTIKFYGTPTYRRRINKRKNARNYRTVVCLDE